MTGLYRTIDCTAICYLHRERVREIANVARELVVLLHEQGAFSVWVNRERLVAHAADERRREDDAL
ncbi:MAG: hypothetical protein ACREMY_08610 [bacterium]